MSINNPIAFAFAAVIPVIIALYLLRLKRKKKVIASTFFWTEMVQDLQANVPFQKLRWNILLLLQILIAIAIISAMIDLSVKAELNEGRRTIFVVDTSASMATADGGTTRFGKVSDSIKTYCRALSSRERVMIIEAGEYASVVLDFTDNIQAIERAMDSIGPEDTRSDIATAYALALSKAADVDKPKIVLASDFSGMDMGLFDDPPYPVNFLQAGGPARNVAITDFMITGVNDNRGSASFNCFLGIRNFTNQPVDLSVEFYADGNLIDVRTIQADTGSRGSKVYDEIPYSGGVVEVRLDITDDLPTDNVAYAIPPASEMMEVLIAGSDPYLPLALAGLPGLRVYQIAESEFVPGAPYDLIFFTNWAPEELPVGNYVFFNPPNRDYLPCTISETVEFPSVTDWDDGHPMLRFVNPGSFNVFSSGKAVPNPGSLSLIDANSTSLMIYGERNYLRSVVFPFDLNSTDLITRPTFPILMFNIVNYFRSYLESSSAGLKTQGIEAVRVDALGEKVRLHTPEGDTLEFPIDAGHAYIDVSRAGVYQAEIVGGSDDSLYPMVANFFDEAESDVATVQNLEQSVGGENVMRFEVQGKKRIWKWLSVIALGILCVEWFFYHRKGF